MENCSLIGFWAASAKRTFVREYKQLTEENRILIYAMKQAGKQQNEMAAALGVSSSTISWELVRNIGL